MSVKLLTECHLEFLSLKSGCTFLFGFTLVKMPHCWKSHVAAHIQFQCHNGQLVVSGLFYLECFFVFSR